MTKTIKKWLFIALFPVFAIGIISFQSLYNPKEQDITIIFILGLLWFLYTAYNLVKLFFSQQKNRDLRPD